MKRAPWLLGLGIAPLCLGAGAWFGQRKAALYENAQLGFRLHPPDFGEFEGGTTHQIAHFFAPVSEQFAPNLNVQLQPVMDMDEFRRLSTEQFKQLGLKVTREEKVKVQGRDSCLWEYEGKMQNRDLRFLSQAIADKRGTYLITGTAAPSQYERFKEAFEASIKTFSFLDAPK